MTRLATEPSPAPTRGVLETLRIGAGGIVGGILTLVLLTLGVVLVGAWHLTQGTSGIGLQDLLAALLGREESVNGV